MGNGKGLSIESILSIEDPEKRDKAILEMQFQTHQNVNTLTDGLGEIVGIKKDVTWLVWGFRALYVSVMSIFATIIGVVIM